MYLITDSFRPVKMHMRMDVNSYSVGKRFPYYIKYKVGFDTYGKVLSLILDLYLNMGEMFDA